MRAEKAYTSSKPVDRRELVDLIADEILDTRTAERVADVIMKKCVLIEKDTIVCECLDGPVTIYDLLSEVEHNKIRVFPSTSWSITKPRG